MKSSNHRNNSHYLNSSERKVVERHCEWLKTKITGLPPEKSGLYIVEQNALRKLIKIAQYHGQWDADGLERLNKQGEKKDGKSI